MKRELNHYEFLGVPERASEEQIERAIVQFEDPAYALAHTDPERTDGLYELLARMRTDLLAGPVRRRAYERSLHPGTTLVTDGMDVAEVFGTPWHVPLEGADTQNSLTEPVRIRGLLAGLALALLLTVTITAGVRRANSFSQAPPPSASLFTSVPQRNEPARSGSVVHLRWTPIRGVLAYQMQVATAGYGSVHHVLRSVLTLHNSYSVRVAGQRMYAWRVRAGGGEKWGPYTAWQAFLVSAPTIGTPTGLRSAVIHSGSKRIARVCWSRVQGARSYLLHVQGDPRTAVHGTCASIPVRVGSYAWTVAAQVMAAHLYTGPDSRTNRFMVDRQSRRTHGSVLSTPSASIPSAPQPHAPQPILVAVALPLPPAPVAATHPSSHHHARTIRHAYHAARATKPINGTVHHGAAPRRFPPAAESTIRALPTAIRLPVRHNVQPAGVSGRRGSGKHIGSISIPPPPAPPPIPVATRVPNTIPPTVIPAPTHVSSIIPPPPPPPPIP